MSNTESKMLQDEVKNTILHYFLCPSALVVPVTRKIIMFMHGEILDIVNVIIEIISGE